MATTSEVKQGLDDIATSIRNCRNKFEQAKTVISNCSAELGAIPTTFSDVNATIQAYTPTGAFEILAQDERDKLVTEFQALKTDIDALIAEF
jgi:kynureninase